MQTFRQRVESFWSWFSADASRFFATIEDGKCAELAPEFQDKCRELLPGFAWVFGPGANGVGHSFTLSGEGDLNLMFLASYWRENAPELEGWTFYSARQPSQNIEDHEIQIAEFTFTANEFLVLPNVNEEEEAIGLEFWHPNFSKCDENLQYTLLNLWIDEVLGELDAISWVQAADVADLSESPSAFSILELGDFITNLKNEKGWSKGAPDETYSLYQLPEPNDAFPRADTISGTSCNMKLIGDYLRSEGDMEDPLEGTGARFIYIGINRDQFPEGAEVDFRGDIEDSLDKTLRENKAGRVFGGAFGLMSGYIDLVIYDGHHSIDLIQQILDERDLEDEYFIRPFATR